MPGWTGDYDWDGFLDFAQLPQESDPPRGWIATANNRSSRPDYPYFLAARWEASYRIRRIGELLGDIADCSPPTTWRISSATICRFRRAICWGPCSTPSKATQIRRSPPPSPPSAALGPPMSRDGPAPLIFATWLHRLLREAIFAQRLGPLYRL